MQPMQPAHAPPAAPPPRRGMPTWLIVLLVVVLVVPFVLGVLAAIAIPSYARYMRRAKTTAAVEGVGRMCHDVRSYVSEHGSLPPSAPLTPADVPLGMRVFPDPNAWSAPGWTAIGFSVNEPTYYSYQLDTSDTGFRAIAYGDLDGNGVRSTFEIDGTVSGGSATCGQLVQVRPLE